jgi:hypothetical protein
LGNTVDTKASAGTGPCTVDAACRGRLAEAHRPRCLIESEVAGPIADPA